MRDDYGQRVSQVCTSEKLMYWTNWRRQLMPCSDKKAINRDGQFTSTTQIANVLTNIAILIRSQNYYGCAKATYEYSLTE